MILRKYKRKKNNKMILKFEDCSKIVLKLEEKDFIDAYENEIEISKGEELNIKYLYSKVSTSTNKEQKFSDKYVLFGNFGEIHFCSEQIIKMESENEPIRDIYYM